MKGLDAICYIGRALVVADSVKEIIEGLEPGKHDFLPLRISSEKGDVILDRWALLLGTVMDDPLIPELCKDVRTTMTYGSVPLVSGVLNVDKANIVFDAEVCEGIHLWTRPPNPGQMSNRVYMTTELLEQLSFVKS